MLSFLGTLTGHVDFFYLADDNGQDISHSVLIGDWNSTSIWPPESHPTAIVGNNRIEKDAVTTTTTATAATQNTDAKVHRPAVTPLFAADAFALSLSLSLLSSQLLFISFRLIEASGDGGYGTTKKKKKKKRASVINKRELRDFISALTPRPNQKKMLLETIQHIGGRRKQRKGFFLLPPHSSLSLFLEPFITRASYSLVCFTVPSPSLHFTERRRRRRRRGETRRLSHASYFIPWPSF